MLRIVRFKIVREKLIKFAETRRDAVKAIQELTDLDSSGDSFYAEPMATTEARYFVVEQWLRSMFGDRIHWDTVDLTADYTLLRTRAPKAYDYGYVIEIGRMDGEFGEERMVAIPKESVAYQSGRYSSGMYTPIDCS